MPCPEVHPLESLVPKPTSNPPKANLHNCTEVDQKPVGERVRVWIRAPITSPMARVNLQLLSFTFFSCWKLFLLENHDNVVVKRLLWVACSPVTRYMSATPRPTIIPPSR
jgi:hypothetical protein